jgi:putative ABC transport system ATP-binding protein
MIALRNIAKRYRMGDEEVMALAGVDLDIGRNEYVALVGPSGSGKSTLMNIIGCLDTPSTGSYLLNGRDTAQLGEVELAGVRNREIGFVFQSFHLLPRMTVLQNVMQPLVYRGMPAAERKRRALDALGKVGLGNRQGHRPNELSGGQRQRVAVARALVGEPSLLLADEPTGNLDSQMARSVMELLEDINQQGTTIVMVTHDPELAARAQRNVHIVDGMATDLSAESGLARAARAANEAALAGA